MRFCYFIICFLLGSVVAYAAEIHVQPNMLNIQHWKTSKGTPVYFVQTKQVPMLVIQIAFDAGSARDGDLSGTATLLNQLLNQGNAGLSATQMAKGFEQVGAQYGHQVSQDMAVVQLKTLSDTAHLNIATDYFADVFRPDFTTKIFHREKNRQMAAIAQSQESPDIIAQQALLAAIYPNHSYGKPILGLKETVEKIQLADLQRFYQQYYVAHNAVISMAGAIDMQTAKNIAEKIIHNLSAGAKPAALPMVKAKDIAGSEQHIAYPATQTSIRLGQVGISRQDPDYFALLVGNYTLGGGMLISRLSQDIREKHGLAYSVNSYFEPMSANGPFVIALATRTEKADEALQRTQHVLQQFLSEGPTAAELTAAKQFIQGNFPLRFETNVAIADMLLIMAFYQLPLNYLDTYLAHIRAVTTTQIQQAFQRHIQENYVQIITVGNALS